MDGWTYIQNRWNSWLSGFSAGQRKLLIASTATVLLGCVWGISISYQTRYEMLLGGKSFSKEELPRILAAFQAAGLNQHHVDGQRISIPSKDTDRYTVAAATQKALPAQFAAEFDRMQSRVNVFTSSEQRREMLEEARKTRLAQILRAIPEIEDAVVEWDRSRPTSLFRPQVQLAAHVSVRPRSGRELSPELIESLKQFIAGALAGAKPEDVTVVDMNSSRVYGRRTAEEAALDRQQLLARQLTEDVNRQITHALQYIPDVLVSVNVELLPSHEDFESRSIDDVEVVATKALFSPSGDSSDHSFEARSNRPVGHQIPRKRPAIRTVRAERSGPKATKVDFETETGDFAAPFQKSVQVAISVPEDFYTDLARRQGAAPGNDLVTDSGFRAAVAAIKGDFQQEVRDKILRLLPAGTTSEAISITSYKPVRNTGTPEASSGNSFQQTLDRVTRRVPENAPIIMVGIFLLVVGASAAGLLRHRAGRVRLAGTAAPEQDPATSSAAQAVGNATSGLQGRTTLSSSTGQRIENSDISNATAHPSESAANRQVDYRSSESGPEAAARINPYSAILAELAERERDTVMGAPHHTSAFEFLCQLTPVDTADFLRNEHPQTIAVVTTGLPTGRAAEVLHALPETLRWDVTQRISRMDPPDQMVCMEIASNLESRLRERQAILQEQSQQSQVRANRSVGHVGRRKYTIKSFSRKTSHATSFLDQEETTTTAPVSSPGNISQTDVQDFAGTSSNVPDPGPVSFEDLCLLDRNAFAAVLRAVDVRTLSLALLDRPEPFKQRFVSLIPRSVTEAIVQQTRSLSPFRLSDVTTAQTFIAGTIWDMAQKGQIQLPPHLVRI